MKICTIGFLLLAFLFGYSQTVPVNWKPLGPFNVHQTLGSVEAPGLGVMRSFDVSLKNPSILIMGGMSSGIWRSNNKGLTWKNTSLNLPVENVKKIQIATSNNTIVYAATTVGVIKSIDNGVSWKFTNLNMVKKLPIAERWNDDNVLLSVSPTNANIVIASNSDTLYKTVDGGNSWKPILVGYKTQFIEFHPKNENIIYTGGAYSKDRNKFFILRSNDAGANFTEITNGIPDKLKLVQLHDITAAVSPASPDKLYVLIFGDSKIKTSVKQEEKKQMVGAFIVSDNAGESFKPVEQTTNYRKIDQYYSVFHAYSADEDKSKYDFDKKDSSFWLASFQQVGWATSFAISPTNPNLMVMAGSNNVCSYDGGHTWDVLRKKGQYGIHGDIQCAKIIGDDVWLTNDGGLNYVNLKDRVNHRMEGFSGQDLWGFSTSFKTDIMAIGVDHSGTMIYDKSLYGNAWYHYGGGDAMSATLNLLDDRYLYATPYNHFIIKRAVTTLEEPITKKSPVSFGYIPNRNVEFHPNLIYNVYAIDENSDHWGIKNCSIVKTTDNFKTVDTLKVFPDKVYIRRLRVSFSNPNYMYVLADKRRRDNPAEVWMSADGGKNWKNITPSNSIAVKFGFPDIAISDIDPTVLYLGVGGFQNEIKVLKSTDAGSNWHDELSSSLPKNAIYTMAFQRGTNEGVYLGCYPGLFYKNASMKQWNAVGANIPYTPINFIAINYNNEKIRLGTYRGVWENDLFETTAPKAAIALNKNILKVDGVDSDEEDPNQLKISFYDFSVIKGKGAKFHWEFPGAIPSESNVENPLVNYSACIPGKYSVKLTITDAKGQSSTTQLKDFIDVKSNYPWILR